MLKKPILSYHKSVMLIISIESSPCNVKTVKIAFIITCVKMYCVDVRCRSSE